MVVTTMDEASMRDDAVEAHRGSYDNTDEAAMLAVVERTTVERHAAAPRGPLRRDGPGR